jgi:threonine synthase
MWKVFGEIRKAGWIDRQERMPRMVVAQADGCAPMVRAFEAKADRATPWENPTTHAAGLRVPGPLGDRLILRALYESNGDAASVSEQEIRDATALIGCSTGIDAAPEGGCALAVAQKLVRERRLAKNAEIVVFNTGSGASYRA